MRYSVFLKKTLSSIIQEMNKTPWLFVRDPQRDFSRVRKWSFGETLRFLISMEGKAVKDELLEYFDYSPDTPTNSSFNQRRAQILPEAFEYIFHEFTRTASKKELVRGYRLLACDGSDFGISHNPEDKTTYFQSLPGTKGFNQIHLNALYDLRARTYADAIIQPARLENENKAVCEMIDRYQGEVKTVFIADRGYESYNIFAHVQEKGMFFLVRVKDILRKGGIVQSLLYKLPVDQDSFDETLTITLTRKQTKLIKDNPDKYRFIPQNVHFDYLDLESRLFYEMNFRIIRFPIAPDSFECIITNLPREDFSLDDVKELYHMRWGCRIKRRIKSCAGAASPFKIALKSRDSHRSFLSLRREPLIQNSPSALMTGRLGHVGLSGCRSCSPHSLLRSVRIRFIRAAYSKQFFRGLPHPSGPDP